VGDVCKMHWHIEENEEHLTGFHEATLAWVRSLGLDPNRLAPRAAVVWHGDCYELHVDEIVQDESGKHDRFDPLNMDNLLKTRKIIPVAKDSWPARPSVTGEVA